jgi:hypothetical protein
VSTIEQAAPKAAQVASRAGQPLSSVVVAPSAAKTAVSRSAPRSITARSGTRSRTRGRSSATIIEPALPVVALPRPCALTVLLHRAQPCAP